MNNNSRLKLFLGDEIDFSEISKSKIGNVLSLPDVSEVIVLPDIHSKPDNPFPTGIVTLASNTIYPFAIGQEIGCGIRILKTSLTTQDINEGFVDNCFNRLREYLRDGRREDALFSKEEYLNILLNGYDWVRERFEIEKRGNINLDKPIIPFQVRIKDILSAVPKDAFWAGYYRLGTLGGGNHFLEIHTIDEIINENICAEFNLHKEQIIFIFHTGSNVFAKRFDNYYAIRFQKHSWDKALRKNFRKFLFHFNDLMLWELSKRLELFFSRDFKGIPANSKEGKKYILGFYAAMNYSFVNRTIISWFIQKALIETMKKDFSLDLLSDVAHERIDYEEFSGKKFWVHRNGATKVIYSKNQVKQMLIIPSCIGGPSFLCIPDEGVVDSRYSVNHGVGRILTKQEAKDRFNNEEIYELLRERNICMYKIGDKDLREQSPYAFKDIQQIISVLKKQHLVNPVAVTSPLAILKA